MKKYLKMSLAVLLVMSLLAGCGGSSMAADSAPAMKQEAAIEAPMAEAPMLNGSIYDAGTGAGNSIADTEQKLIKTVRMDVETEDLENLLPQISGKISSLGGYVENQELYNGSA